MRLHASIPLAMIFLLLPELPAWAGGSPVGPGVISLPPITAKFDDRCLDRVDHRDERLAARQARECRKPRGARAALPSTEDRAVPADKPAPR